MVLGMTTFISVNLRIPIYIIIHIDSKKFTENNLRTLKILHVHMLERKMTMNKEMSLFDFKDRQIRVLADENGDPWFVAKDVCDILDIRNVSQAVSSLDEYEKTNISTVYIWNEPGKAPVIINESGLYSLIFKSRKQEAKDFKLWVTSEVLPSIRKTGSYSVGQAKAISEEDNKHKLEVQSLDFHHVLQCTEPLVVYQNC